MTDLIVCACMTGSMEWKLVGPPQPKLPPPKTREESLARLQLRQKIGKVQREGELPALPKSREEALSLGWAETELGWDCPACVARKKEEADADERAGATTEVATLDKMLSTMNLGRRM